MLRVDELAISSRSAAEALLRTDAVRRVWLRAAKLTGAAFILALLVWEITLVWVIIPTLPEGAGAGFPRIGDSFGESVDPVLPSLVGALLAVAVIKATSFGSEILMHTADLIAGLAVFWAFMSLSALLPVATADAGAHALSAVALAAVCVAVSVTITEVLPLSERVRRRQLHRQTSTTQAACNALVARASGARLLRTASRPISPRKSWWILVCCYVIPPLAVLAASAPFVLVIPHGLHDVVFVIAVGGATLLIGLIAAIHQLAIEYLQSTGSLRRFNLAMAGLIALALLGAILSPFVPLIGTTYPFPLLPLPATLLGLGAIASTLVPRLRRSRRWAPLLHAAVARRSFALQLKLARYEQLLAIEE